MLGEELVHLGLRTGDDPAVILSGEHLKFRFETQGLHLIDQALRTGRLDHGVGFAALRYVDHLGMATERYPYNPNGSPAGITGLTTTDGRFSILMPHPERVFRTVQMSWQPPGLGEDSPWMRMFRNARRRVG